MGRLTRTFLVGLLVGLTPMGCAGVAWRYYGVSMPEACYDQGTLLGPQPKYDLPLVACKPDASSSGKCVLMLQDEFFRLLADDKQCHVDLNACQGKGP